MSDNRNNDPVEKSLDKYLEGDSDLSRLYSASKTETTANESFDLAILDAAKQSVGSKPAMLQRSKLKRWAVPTSVAATLLLSTSLYLHNHQQLDSLQSPAPYAPSRLLLDNQRATDLLEDEALDRTVPSPEGQTESHSRIEEEAMFELDALKAEAPAIDTDKQYEKKKSQSAVTGNSSEPSALKPLSQKARTPGVASLPVDSADAGAPEKDSKSTARYGITPSTSRSQAEMKTEARQKKDQVTSSVAMPELQKEARNDEPPQESAKEFSAQMESEPTDHQRGGRDTPYQWLKSIESLIKAGKVHAAKDELEAFEIRYPNYPLPDRIKKFKEIKFQ
ncbi:hypothetical protein [Motiliproteus sp. MSK22-1]|uniref:hypothetical protein n=1 Tax=Motiliproteus sp. MSK22-1 TaxID=1897630 RepID=UPI0009768C67|nr:hypothetical protein [Motiliproteus sp. MSK22-1]OMH39254.1 hypothetical protein BGP75_03935 [Motiliproteus sp. MSK22-1]